MRGGPRNRGLPRDMWSSGAPAHGCQWLGGRGSRGVSTPWVRSPGLRGVCTREPGAGGRCPFHDRGCGRGWLSFFLSLLLTISVPGASLFSRLEVPTRFPGVAGHLEMEFPRPQVRSARGLLLSAPASTMFALHEGH